MKIQELAIIFVIIILPISLVLSAYSQHQIQTLNTQTLYDSQLTAATHDAIKAYQINAENSTTSELANSKIRDLEASIGTFKNSIMSSFRLNGYTEEELNNYIPALVYTMYDGFYIYSPFENIADAGGNIIADGDSFYGLKPYISYSCRYKTSYIDVVITYSLDNYIKVQGMIGAEYVNTAGYLIDGIEVNGSAVKYNGETIGSEQLKEYLPIPKAGTNTIPDAYPYVKINGTKYYRVDINSEITGDDSIIYFLNGTIKVQCEKTEEPNDEFSKYSTLIDNNNQAKQYYKDASGFTNWVKENLSSLRWRDAVHDVQNEEDEIREVKIWEDNETFIFDDSTNIENEISNFNQHRLAVIRQKIEENLSTAIKNYNLYSGSRTNDFQMPELKEDEWDYITHNIALISFLQGLPIGGKIYNGYTIVTNSESEEVVLESNIYILGYRIDGEGIYCRIGETNLESGVENVQINPGFYGEDEKSAGRLNLDFKRKVITNNNKVLYYYPLKDCEASYESIIMRDEITPYEDIYDYINSQSLGLKNAFYTALGRERYAKYNSTTTLDDSYFTKLGVTPEGTSGGGIPGGTPGGTPGGVPGATPDGAPIIHDELYKVTYYPNHPEYAYIHIEDILLKGTKVKPIRAKDYLRGLGAEGLEEYTFLGWSTDPNATSETVGTLYQPGQEYTLTGNINFFGVWKKTEYIIKYNANGGYGGPNEEKKIYGESYWIYSGAPPTRDGYRFKGWSIVNDSTADDEYNPGSEYTRNENLELYAVWRKLYTIKYDANEGIGGPSEDDIKEHGVDLILSSEKPRRTGYIFKGWTRTKGSSEEFYEGNLTYTYNADAILYAVWEPEKYPVRYNANGGTGAPSEQLKIYDQTLTLTSQKPTRTGHTFIGWSVDNNSSVEYNSGSQYTQNAEMTLYAVWQPNTYTITYDANGGEGAPGSQSGQYGQSIRLSEQRPRKIFLSIFGWELGWYDFEGWIGSDGQTYSPGQQITITGNLNLVAKWSSLNLW